MDSITAKDLRSLIRLQYGTVRAFAPVVGLSENTINTHLKDGNWDRNQMVSIIKACKIPNKFIYVYFFEDELTKQQA